MAWLAWKQKINIKTIRNIENRRLREREGMVKK